MNKKAVINARAILGIMLFCMAVAFSARVSSHEDFNVSTYSFEADEHSDEAAFSNLYLEKPPAIAQNEEAEQVPEQSRPRLEPLTQEYIARLSDFDYLTRSIFLTDPRTKLLETDIDISEFLATDFTIDTNMPGPQVLIFHAHSMEMFADSDPDDPMTGVFGVGRYLAEILETQHNINTLHFMGRFDVVDGIPQRQGSYERLEPVIRQILTDNPSIQVVIDLHRDGVGPHVEPMVTYVNGQRTAQIMFVNGLSRRFRNGEIIPVQWLPNPYQQENLAFSFNLQLAANQMYPGLARRIYLLEYRYSLQMAPQSILLEVGAQNNTFQEALNAMPPMANIIAAVVLE